MEFELDKDELEPYRLELAIGSLFVAANLVAEEKDTKRRTKMKTVTFELLDRVREEFADKGVPAEPARDALLAFFRGLRPEWSREDAVRCAVEWGVNAPFGHEYYLKFSDDDRWEAITELGAVTGLSGEELREIRKVKEDAENAHKPSKAVRLILAGAAGIAGVALVVLSGGLLAAALAPAGLTGGAAVLAGLAALGGGAVATGGMGVAGGIWILAGLGAVGGAVSATSAAQVLGATSSALVIPELVKAQVLFDRIYLQRPGREGAVDALNNVVLLRDAMDDEVERLEARNEDDAPAVKNTAEVHKGFRRAVEWMTERLGAE